MSQGIERLLLEKFPPPAYACLPQLRNSTGHVRVARTADCVVMSLYPSRGLHLYGFEIKEHRGDWLSELKNPAKAEEIAQYCHEWWLVTGDATIAKPDELPKPWGHMTVVREPEKPIKLKVLKQPEFNKEAKEPTMRFVGAILRNAMGRTPENILLEEARREGREQGFQDGLKQGQARNYQHLYETHDALVKQIKEYEKASGLQLQYGWQHANIGLAVKRILDGENQARYLENMAEQADRIAQQIRLIRKKI